jgi:hypothetical protein
MAMEMPRGSDDLTTTASSILVT